MFYNSNKLVPRPTACRAWNYSVSTGGEVDGEGMALGSGELVAPGEGPAVPGVQAAPGSGGSSEQQTKEQRSLT